MHYRLVAPKDEGTAGILGETLKHLQRTPEMRRDISRLTSACCTPEKYDLLQAALQPAVVTVG
jgi:ArsR family transcriptional regulator